MADNYDNVEEGGKEERRKGRKERKGREIKDFLGLPRASLSW